MGDSNEFGQLRAVIGGDVVLPDDHGYDEARAVWNGVIDRRPAAIARCRSVDDVVAAIGFGREHGLPIAMRGGGHNVAGTGTVDGGLLVDLGLMNGVEVDVDGRRARVGGGASLGDVDRATQAHGLATSFGVVSETGVAGLTLSGGMGWLRRRHGLSCDNLVSAQVVTADGSVLTASESEHPDLFWGLRGGGGNFGVVTSFEFHLHPVGPQVALVFVMYPGERAAEVLSSVASLVPTLPNDVAPLAFLGRVPAEESFPVALHGAPFAAVAAVHPGDPEEGLEVLAPLRALGDPLADMTETMPYVEAQRLLDGEYPNGRRYYWKAIELDELSTGAIERLMASAADAPSDLSTIDVWFQGGAMSAVPADATAYGDRSSPILIGVEANWEGADTDDANIGWAKQCVEDLRPFSDGGTYLNFPGFLDEQDQQTRDAFGDNLGRLAEVKRAYDPDNVFRVNHNVAPAPL
jgi:FAD/FMN-containing dehydrogenase